MFAAKRTRARAAAVTIAALALLCSSMAVGGPSVGAAANDCIEVVNEIDFDPGFTGSMVANGTDLYVTVDEEVVKVDTTTETEVDRQDLNAFLGGMAVTDGKLYVTTIDPDEVAVLDADTLDPITTISGFATPVRPSVVNGLVYVPQQSSNDVLVIDPATDTVVDTIASLAANGSYAINGMVYVMGLGTSGIDVIDPAAGSSVGNIAVGNIPIGMVNIGSQAWVTNAADNTVSEVDLDTNTAVGTAFPVAGNPRSIVLLQGALYYSSNEDAVVQAIDPATNALGTSLQFPGGPDAELTAMVVIGERIYLSGLTEVHVIALCANPDTTTTTGGTPTNPATTPARAAVPLAGAVPRFTG